MTPPVLPSPAYKQFRSSQPLSSNGVKKKKWVICCLQFGFIIHIIIFNLLCSWSMMFPNLPLRTPQLYGEMPTMGHNPHHSCHYQHQYYSPPSPPIKRISEYSKFCRCREIFSLCLFLSENWDDKKWHFYPKKTMVQILNKIQIRIISLLEVKVYRLWLKTSAGTSCSTKWNQSLHKYMNVLTPLSGKCQNWVSFLLFFNLSPLDFKTKFTLNTLAPV